MRRFFLAKIEDIQYSIEIFLESSGGNEHVF